STKEMGEGSRHDTLNDIWGNTNYRKFIAMGSLLPKKLWNAIIQCEKHNEQHEIFCGVIPDMNKAEWTTMINQWENNKSKPDPYVIETIFQSQAAIRLELVAAECASLSVNEMESMQPSPSAFISSGLDIKEAQQGLSFEVHKLKSSSTDTQKANVKHCQLALQKRLAGFCSIQTLHMPEVAALLLSDSRVNPDTPETSPLYLPHELLLTSCSLSLNSNLAIVEAKLHFAQVTDSLAELRHALSVFAHLKSYKIREVWGQ
ncbi:hypothetical protein BS47DRAFT_1306050, partial [Hydnum rufescens UP504]